MQRPIEFLAPSIKDVIWIRRAYGTEELGRMSEFHLELVSPTRDIDLDTVLGERVSLKIQRLGDKARYLNGHVTRFSYLGRRGRHHAYNAIVHPWLWFLTRTTDYKIHRGTVPEIIKAIIAEHGFSEDVEFKQTRNYLERNFCVQYGETDFNLVSRLMEEEGLYYFFRHEEGKHSMVITDDMNSLEPFKDYEEIPFAGFDREVREDEEVISDWQLTREIQPGKYVLRDFDYKKPSFDMVVRSPSKKKPHKFSELELYEYPGGYFETEYGDRQVTSRLDEIHSRYELIEGHGNARGIAVGCLFKLTNHPREEQNRQYLIVRTTLELRVPDYESFGASGSPFECGFKALDGKHEFRPARITSKPRIYGPQTATVVGPKGDEIHTDLKHGLARVKVQFHWDRYGKNDENSSCWIRVAQPWAGKGWGSVSLPRIGQEVVIDFLEGDPDRPLITNRVYNGDNKPPYPTGMVSGLKSNTHKGKGSNEMSMDDTAGKEKVFTHAQYDMTTVVEHDDSHTVNNGNKTITVKTGTHTETIKGNTKVTVQTGTHELRVDANSSKHTAKNDITIASDTAHIYVQANTNIQLHVGASTLWMGSNGDISLNGVNISINGSASVTIHGGIVHSEADSEHQTKGAIVLSEGSGTNTVKGGMVMLNP